MNDEKTSVNSENESAIIVVEAEADGDLKEDIVPAQTITADEQIIGTDTEAEETEDTKEEKQELIEEEPAFHIDFKKIALYSMMILSSVIFLTSVIIGAVNLTKDLSRDEVLSKITQSLLATVFGSGDSINEIKSTDTPADRDTSDSESDADLSDSEQDSSSPSESDRSEYPPSEIYDIKLNITNETPYLPDMKEILRSPRTILKADELYSEYGESAPLVLLLHTHGTEGYSDSADSGYRTEDTSRNVVEIGRLIAKKLRAAGINTIHCETMFDADDFTLAYYNASLEIKKTLAVYPSVSYIIDIHRDSIETADGEYYAPTASIGGIRAAQLMFVIGTDHGGSGHTTWRNNLSLASRIQANITLSYPNLMRDINLRSASFNEQYRDGSLLLEVGSCASTLDEAKLGAEIFADHLIEEILG
ncbi:MAG: hypothetical protein E7672_05120 [Ruminococcaceae bacterium]|nr:hypothetical protein [Oscillospiraceae bacterium]